MRELTGGEGADYAFEVIGLTETARQALLCTKRGGKAVIIGVMTRVEIWSKEDWTGYNGRASDEYEQTLSKLAALGI